ncbi:MAG: Cna B-type domain-containing protein, partial [Clostridia bacterium]|nr:Cna B-type domain-containing protein [Clostridia bacterium]
MKKQGLRMATVWMAIVLMLMTGMTPAMAKGDVIIDHLTVDYIFDSLGDAVNYGVVARVWKQNDHAETNACVDLHYRLVNTVFAPTDKTYGYTSDYILTADISAPESLQGMTFALFKQQGNGYVKCTGTDITVGEDINSTTLEWDVDDELNGSRLFVMQVDDDGYVENGDTNSDGLVVSYGPSISSSVNNNIYIGKVYYEQEYGMNDAMGIFNVTTYSPTLIFGKDTRLFVYVDVEDENGQKYKDFVPLELNKLDQYDGESVYVNYYYGDINNPQMGRMKLQGAVINDGVITIDGNIINVEYTNYDSYADSLIDQAEIFSQELANLGGGVITSLTPDPTGSSTVTGPVDNEYVVSVYDVEVGENDTLGPEDLGVPGIPVAENEYVVVNVICNSRDGEVYMGHNNISYYLEDGTHEVADFKDPGAEGSDSGACQRVIYNYVYSDEDGILRPFEGTVYPNKGHGGTILAPNALVNVVQNPHDGAVICNEFQNNGKEMHQRTMSSLGHNTWVKMNGGYLTLDKVAMEWQAGGGWGGSYVEGDPLPGAVFGVYTDEACTQLVDKITTDENGVATSGLLAAGDYWVKEITPPDGYGFPTDMQYNPINPAVKVTVVAGDEPTKVVGPGYQYGWDTIGAGKFVNTQSNTQYGDLRVEKIISDNGKPLQGVTFGVYTRQGGYGRPYTYELVGTMTTNRNGVAVYYDLPIIVWYGVQPYYVKEISAPDGYKISNEEYVEVYLTADGMVTVDGNSDADGNAFENEIIRGNMKLTKVAADDTSKTLGGAEFTIYSDASCTTQVGVMKTNPQGYADSTAIEQAGKQGLLPGTYYVKETKAPAGYRSDGKVYTVKVLPDQTVDVVEGNIITNEEGVTIKVEKKWKDKNFEGERPEFVNIHLYRNGEYMNKYIDLKEENGWKGEFTDLEKYDENGKLYEYTLKEQETGWNNKYFIFIEDNTEPNGTRKVVFTNSIRKVNINIKKNWTDNAGQWDAAKPNEIVYELYYLEGKDNKEMPMLDQNGNQLTVKGDRNSNWRAQFANLPLYGQKGEEELTYLVKEQTSGSYVMVEYSGLVENGADSYDVTFTNQALVRIQGRKIWEDNNNAANKRPTKPDQVNIVLYQAENQGGTATKVEPQPEITWTKTEGNEWTWEFNGLPKGPYYTVQEENVPDGYEAKVNGYDITNTYSAVYINVTKAWSGINENTVLPDSVTVQLYVGDQKVEGKTLTLTAANNWQGTFENLPKKDQYNNDITYTVMEESEVKGFRVSVEGNQSNGYTITNSAIGGFISLKKVDADNPSTGLQGAVFGVYSDQACQNKVTEMTTDNNGNAKSIELAPGTYWVKEDKAPNGYTANKTDAVSVTVVKDQTVTAMGDAADGAFTNAAGKGKLFVKKAGTDSNGNNPQPLAGAEFTVYDGAGNVMGTMTTNDQGYAEIELPVGNYQIKETKAPTGYRIDDNGGKWHNIQNVGDSVQVWGNYTYNGEQGWFRNTQVATGGIKLTKVSAQDQNVKLDGAVFYVYSDQNCQNKVGEMTTDGNGIASLTGLEANRQYWVKEYSAPEGYDLNTQVYSVYVNANNNDNWVNNNQPITNNKVQDKGAISLTKVSAEDANTKLQGAEFTVYADENCSQYVGMMQTDANGAAKLEGLIAGNTYWVKETKAPAGYKLSDTKYSVTVVKDTITPINNGNAITNEVSDGVGSIYLYKVATDSNGNNPSGWLAGAEFDVFMVENWQKGQKVGTMTTDENGYAEFTVPSLGQYIVVEAKAPAGYEKDYGERWVEVQNEGDHKQVQGDKNYNGTNNCIGNKKQQTAFLELYKLGAEYDAEGNADYATIELLSGVEFTVTANDNSIDPIVFTTENGYAKVELPANMDLTLKETKAPEGYELTENAQIGIWLNSNETRTLSWWGTSFQGTNGSQIYWPDDTYNGSLINKKIKQPEGGFKFTKQAADGTALPGAVFGVYAEEGCTTKLYELTSAADGVVSLTELDAGKTYYIKEIIAPTGYVLDATVYSVTIEANVNDKPVGNNGIIVNEKIADATAQLQAGKTLNGAVPAAGQFSFTLTGNGVNETKQNDANGLVVFDELTFTAAGTYVYQITEQKPNPIPAGYTYDENTYTATVNVALNAQGTALEASVSYNTLDGNAPVFQNTYTAEGSVTFAGTKALTGKTLEAGQFSFELYNAENKLLQTVTNDADGNITFVPITYTLSDVVNSPFTYTVSEVSGNLPGVDYDDTVYTVEVTVSDNGSGALVVEPSANYNALAFENEYKAEGSVTFTGTKTIEGRALTENDAFTFEIKEGEDVIGTATNDASGKIGYPTIEYTLDDVGDHTYTVKETSTDGNGITVDTTEYTVTVNVSDNGDGTLSVTADNN